MRCDICRNIISGNVTLLIVRFALAALVFYGIARRR
jgi:hypothetical protein